MAASSFLAPASSCRCSSTPFHHDVYELFKPLVSKQSVNPKSYLPAPHPPPAVAPTHPLSPQYNPPNPPATPSHRHLTKPTSPNIPTRGPPNTQPCPFLPAGSVPPGLELLLLQAAQPQPVPEVHLPLPRPALRHHHHLPLDHACRGCAAAAGPGLRLCAVHLEPQRLAKQSGGQAERDAEDFGTAHSAAGG